MATPTKLQKPNTRFTSPPNANFTQTQPASSNTSRTHRLTENKRRYRARRKEYVLDLESKLAETREQGVQATKEVQQAARRVVHENRRLRELLKLAGFSDEDVDLWVGCGGQDEKGDGASCARRREMAQRARSAATVATREAKGVDGGRMPVLDEEGGRQERSTTGDVVGSGGGASLSAAEPVRGRTDSSDRPDLSAAPVARNAITPTQDPPIQEAVGGRGEPLPPCKLLTRLAKNPGVDFTMVPELKGSGEHLEHAPSALSDEGIECSKAYHMLMAYAVCEEKMDYVAKTLEGGCRANGKGGCAVKSKVVLQALDDMVG